MRNGSRSKTVLTESLGHVEIEVPRDRAGTFEPQIVRKRQRRLTGVDEIVLSLYAKGLTTGEISAHFARSSRSHIEVVISPVASVARRVCPGQRLLGTHRRGDSPVGGGLRNDHRVQAALRRHEIDTTL